MNAALAGGLLGYHPVHMDRTGKILRTVNLVIAFAATTAPLAHVLEMPSKFALDGPLWLAIQQHLYRGWGAVFGPVEILALLTSVGLLFVLHHDVRARRTYLIASLCYAAMIVVFFIFNNSVNTALNGWSATTLPSNWQFYRLRWETGHALAALFSVVAFITVMRSRLAPRKTQD